MQEAMIDEDDYIMSAERLHELCFQVAGAASVPFMKAHPDFTMPTEEIKEGVLAVMKDFEIDTN